MNAWPGTSGFCDATDNFNPDWLRWEEYARNQVADPDTQYLFYQWRRPIEPALPPSRNSRPGSPSAEARTMKPALHGEDREVWRQTFRRTFADWLYDFPEPAALVAWADPASPCWAT